MQYREEGGRGREREECVCVREREEREERERGEREESERKERGERGARRHHYARERVDMHGNQLYTYVKRFLFM